MKKKISKSKLLLFCSPHNPVGRVWDYEELLMVGNLCRKHNVEIISDEIHSDLILSNKEHYSMYHVAEKCNLVAVICMSPSKTFNLAGLNISYALIPNYELREKIYKELYKTGFYHNNITGVMALQSAYEECDSWLDSLIVYLKGNRDLIYNRLNNYSDRVKIINPEGTYLMLIQFLRYTSAEIVSKLEMEFNLVVEDGTLFKCEEGYIRINFACPKMVILKVVDKLEKFILQIK